MGAVLYSVYQNSENILLQYLHDWQEMNELSNS